MGSREEAGCILCKISCTWHLFCSLHPSVQTYLQKAREGISMMETNITQQVKNVKLVRSKSYAACSMDSTFNLGDPHFPEKRNKQAK